MSRETRPNGPESGTFDRLMSPPSRWRGIRLKLTGTYFMVSAAVLGLALTIDVYGIPGTGFHGSIEVRTEAARKSLGRQADMIAAEIRLWIEGKKQQAATLAGADLVGHRIDRLLVEARTNIGPGFPAAGYWREQDLGEAYSDLFSLFRLLVDAPDGPCSVWLVDAKSERIVLATDITDMGVGVPESGFVHDVLAKNDSPGAGVCSCGSQEGLEHFVVAYPVRGGDEALLVMHFDPNAVLTPVLTVTQDGESSLEAFAVDRDGVLLTSLGRLLPNGAYPQLSDFHMEDHASTLAAEGSEDLIECRDYRGEEVLAAIRSVAISRDHSWGLVVKRDLAEVLAPLHASVRHVVLAGLAAMVALVVLFVLVARSFVRPIQVIARAAYSIAGGDFGARAPVTNVDEIGAMASVFNTMADRIQETHEDLENRVEERTARLTDAMTALEVEIDERRRTEARLRESEATYRAVTEKLPVMICRVRPDGEITLANEAYRRYFQQDAAGLVGRNIGTLVLEVGFDVVRDCFTRMTAEMPTEDHEHRSTTVKDGVRWVHWSNRALFDTSGEMVSILSVGVDITEHREAVEEVHRLSRSLEQRVQERTAELTRRVNEVEDLNRAMLNLADDLGRTNSDLESAVRGMEEANRELQSFAYSVSHDLRAPLRHIAGFVGLLQQSLADRLGEDDRRYLTLVAQSAERMSQLIDDLLEFSRTGTRELQPVDVDLAKVVREVSGEIENRAGDRKITWRIGALPVVLGDRVTLRLALVNLLENAVKYTRTREQAVIEIGAGPSDDGMETVWVRDNGVGFDPEYAGKLFGVFQRLHRQEDFEGTGIGLANVRRIINRHGGRTWAEGEIDRGATFFFSLPEHPGQTRTDG